ncbi:hypothetical protein [Brachybacterium timonense]|uniref:hypothetical protein n=1 Tax=Brachybacterium timonense TaxID=2050896 RepID=UPI000D0B521D|nr:hypothetical protein [Brachybacterium timonense]
MTESDSTASRPRRARPTYGLPGPVDSGSAPSGDGAASGPHTIPTGSTLLGGPGSGEPPTRPRRRARVPLALGLVLLVVIAPVFFIGGIAWAMSSVVGDAGRGPTEFTAAEQQITLEANHMVFVYVPAEATDATCTASGGVTTIASDAEVTFGNGSTYRQALGVAATSDTTATITCTGTDAPAYLGPYSMFGIALPLLLGPVIGVLAGLVGLVLTIVGIVLMVRRR